MSFWSDIKKFDEQCRKYIEVKVSLQGRAPSVSVKFLIKTNDNLMMTMENVDCVEFDAEDGFVLHQLFISFIHFNSQLIQGFVPVRSKICIQRGDVLNFAAGAIQIEVAYLT